MSDAIKIALKTALIAGVMALAAGIITQVQLPQVDLGIFTTIMGHGRAIVNYYGGTTILPDLLLIGLGLLGLRYIFLPGLYIGSIAVKWIFKVNE